MVVQIMSICRLKMQPDLSHDHIHHSGSKNKLEQDVLAFPSPIQGFFLQLGLC